MDASLPVTLRGLPAVGSITVLGDAADTYDSDPFSTRPYAPGGLTFLNRAWNVTGAAPLVYDTDPDSGGLGPYSYAVLSSATITETAYFTWGGAYDSTTGKPVRGSGR